MQDLSITSSVKDAGKFGTTTADHIRGSRVAKKTGGYSRSANSEASADFPSIKKDYEDSLIALTSLTDEEIQSVRDSWLILKAHIEKIGVIVFLGLFEEHSDFRDAFARFRGKQLVEITRDPALQAHGLRVLNVVDKLVGRLQKVEAIQDFILSLGSRHCKYVPSINLIPSVGEQLLEAIQPALEEQGMWTESTQRGWKAVLSYLTNAMRYGLARTPQTSLNIT
ncbi:unnamed protein product [Echinostoma caproni]|uniref:GLOBIN domain-containing protein n=1 Tax=Echinostoma caproni TaxID=27848 RepID=A0A183A7M0_9TREM|nr:unnamed protein product [Echinostoma caproni]